MTGGFILANVPAKIIERKLSKEGINVNGYYVIDGIEIDYLEEANKLGMNNGITEDFDFISEFPIEDGSITFYGSVIEDYRQISPNQEIPYYYPYLESCMIKKEGNEEKIIELDIYWGK